MSVRGKRFLRSLVSWCPGVLVSGVLLHPAHAQGVGGVHPTVGPLSPGLVPQYLIGSPTAPPWPDHPAASPLLNIPFTLPISLPPYPAVENIPGKWNFGEAAGAADTGGFNTWPNPDPQLDVHVHQYCLYPSSTAEGWQSQITEGINVWRLRGYLRPSALPTAAPGAPADPLAAGPLEPTRVRDAAFEIIVPQEHDPNKRTVIVLQSPPTFVGKVEAHTGIGPDIGVPFAYVGFDSHSGLERHEGYGPQQQGNSNWAGHVPLMWANEASGSPKFNLWCVRVMPQLVFRPTRFQMQRNLEIVRAVQKMLLHPLVNGSTKWRPPTAGWQAFAPTPNFDPAPFTCVAEGGSLGGAVSMVTAVLFPSDFHGAVSSGACPSIRSWVGEQEAHRQIGALSGFIEQSSEFSPNEALHYASAVDGIARHFYGPAVFSPTQLANWSPFYHASLTGAWRDGLLKRPVYTILSDEDHVSSGIDTIPLFTGVRSFQASGVATSNNRPPIYFSVVPKSSHFADQRPFSPAYQPVRGLQFANVPTPPLSVEEAILEFLPAAIQSRDTNPTVPFVPPTRNSDATQDSWDHVLQPAAPVPEQPPPGTGGPLRLDHNFIGQIPAQGSQNVLPLRNIPDGAKRLGKLFGSGTYLSPGDSILGLAESNSFCVGSAEGVVTRFALVPRTSTAPNQPLAGELVPQAMSISLGYGAWSMCRAQAKGTATKEIIVATRRGLHALHYENLTVQLSTRNLGWELANPRFLQSVDAVPGGYEEVIFASENGTVAVFECDPSAGAFNEVSRFSEPGILDMHVMPYDPNGAGNGLLTIYILSARGHVLMLEWDPSLVGVRPTVVATSPRLNGFGVDMEWTGVPGKELAVLRTGVNGEHQEEIWYLNAANLSAVGGAHRQLGVTGVPSTPGALAPHRSTSQNIAVWSPLSGAPELILLRNGQISRFGIGGTAHQGFKDLASFPPFARTIGIGVAEIDSQSSGPEIILSTEAGYVGWMPYTEFATGSGGDVNQFSWYAGQSTSNTRPTSVNAMHGRTNRTLSATWGMAVDDSGSTASTLEVVDQSGSRWSVHANGNVAFKGELGYIVTEPISGTQFWGARPGPYRSLKRVGMSMAMSSPIGNPFHVEQDPQAGILMPLSFAGPSSVQTIKTWPFAPEDGTFPSPRLNVAGGEWVTTPSVPNRVFLEDGYISFPMSGDVLMDDLNAVHMAWWSGEPWQRKSDWANRVQGVAFGLLAPPPPAAPLLDAQYWWSTSGGSSSSSQQTLPTTQALPGHDLRNHGHAAYSITDAQALRLFRDPVNGQPRIALNTPGGRLMVLEPGSAATQWMGLAPKEHAGSTSLDFGQGGMALATSARGDGQIVDLYLAPLIDYTASTAFHGPNVLQADDLTSCLVQVPFQGATNFGGAALQVPTVIRLDGQNGRPKVYGVCGMEVADILPSANPNAAPGELIVGSLDGHLLVYERLTNGQIGSLLYQTQVEGAVGAYNSIVVADLDRDGVKELYVAGSLGLRKWIKAP